jgi:hypothetical protein
LPPIYVIEGLLKRVRKRKVPKVVTEGGHSNKSANNPRRVILAHIQAQEGPKVADALGQEVVNDHFLTPVFFLVEYAINRCPGEFHYS